MTFKLHETLEKDLVEIGKLGLCSLYMLPDSDNPWAVIVPELEAVREMHELSESDQITLMKEITRVSSFMQAEFKADKMNVGALGNMVPQLHIHIICRFEGDKAWPGAIWGSKLGQDKEMISAIENTLKKLV
ncbi:HIT family protein [bacterium]|nr:HIT family protein [bacterium]